MEEIKLSGSVVRYEVIPMTMGFDIMSEFPELKYPEEPVRVVKTKVGTEVATLSHESPEWKAYQEQYDAVTALRIAFATYLPWHAGVKEWKLAGSDEWQSQPPQDYALPDLLRETKGLQPFAPHLDNRRIAYVRYVVCRNMGDVNVLSVALTSGSLLSTEEVDAAVEGFPGDAPRGADEKPARKRGKLQ